MGRSRIIYILGAPCSGTSCVAGILRHLGVDMGEGHFIKSRRPYETFEDSRCSDYRAEPTEAQRFIMGDQGGRDFRSYLEMRLRNSSATAQGVKTGAAYWLGDPDPASLPVTIVKVDRPLGDSIRSDWRYQFQEKTTPAVGSWADAKCIRAAQMAGYWMAKERLCEIIEPAITVPFYEVLREPAVWCAALVNALGLEVTGAQTVNATDSVKRPTHG